jgi:serine/threonine protein phosphatase PrpC
MTIAMTQRSVSLEVFGLSDVGKARTHNEDGFVIADLNKPANEEPAVDTSAGPVVLTASDFGVLLAVSDGMGGAQAGECASALTLHALRTELPVGTGGTAESALIASVEKANQRVYQAALSETGKNGMGATLTAVLVHGTRAFVAEIGDSRAYVLRGGRLVPLTRDQSFVQALLDEGALSHEEAEHFAYKNVILQAVGIRSNVRVALNRFTLRQRDRLLLCSDGLTNEVTDEEIRACIARHPSLQVACTELVDLANSRGGSDNITVVLAEMQKDGLPEPTSEGRVSLETIQTFSWRQQQEDERSGAALGTHTIHR